MATMYSTRSFFDESRLANQELEKKKFPTRLPSKV